MSTTEDTPAPPAGEPKRRGSAISEMPPFVEKVVIPVVFLLVRGSAAVRFR